MDKILDFYSIALFAERFEERVVVHVHTQLSFRELEVPDDGVLGRNEV